MKKPFMIVLTVLCTFSLLTGCGTAMPDLTEEQNEKIVEYAAGMVLKYSIEYDNGLATQAEIDSEDAKEKAKQERALQYKKEKEEKKKAEAAAKKETVSGSSAVAQTLTFENPAVFLELEDINIAFSGFEICDSYPPKDDENYYFSLDAVSGKKLLVLKFSVTNQSSEERNVDILSKYPLIRVSINGGDSFSTLTTLLLDDLSTYQGPIPAGESKEFVIMAEVPEPEVEAVETLSLLIKYNGSTATMPLQ